MKFTLKELELLKKGLTHVTCTADPLYEKITKKILSKKFKKAGATVKKILDEQELVFDLVNQVCFYTKKEDDLKTLSRSICGIEKIKYRNGSCGTQIIEIHVDERQTTREELNRILDYRNKNKNVEVYLNAN